MASSWRSALWMSAGANWISAVSFFIAYVLSSNVWLLIPSGIFGVAGVALLLVGQHVEKRHLER